MNLILYLRRNTDKWMADCFLTKFSGFLVNGTLRGEYFKMSQSGGVRESDVEMKIRRRRHSSAVPILLLKAFDLSFHPVTLLQHTSLSALLRLLFNYAVKRPPPTACHRSVTKLIPNLIWKCKLTDIFELTIAGVSESVCRVLYSICRMEHFVPVACWEWLSRLPAGRDDFS